MGCNPNWSDMTQALRLTLQIYHWRLMQTELNALNIFKYTTTGFCTFLDPFPNKYFCAWCVMKPTWWFINPPPPPSKRSLQRQSFHRCLSVQGGGDLCPGGLCQGGSLSGGRSLSRGSLSRCVSVLYGNPTGMHSCPICFNDAEVV